MKGKTRCENIYFSFHKILLFLFEITCTNALIIFLENHGVAFETGNRAADNKQNDWNSEQCFVQEKIEL